MGAWRGAPRFARVAAGGRLAAPLLFVLALSLVLLPTGAGAAPAALPTGIMVAPRGSGLFMVDAATGAEWPVAVMPPVGVAGHAAWSPDGTRVALSRFGRRPAERVGGSDILVVGAAGGMAAALAEHDAEGALLGSPAWTRDGSGLYYDYLPPNGGPIDSRVEYVAADGTGQRVVAQPGAWPSLTVDGQALLYVRPSRASSFHDELVLLPLDGSPEHILVPGGRFVQIVSPRQSPDSLHIGFVGSLTAGEDTLGREPGGDTFFKLGVRAHGPPGDLWVLGPHDPAPWQRTAFEEDEPTIAWSPDGVFIAMLSGGGLYMIDVEGWRPSRVIGPGGFGSIDWR